MGFDLKMSVFRFLNLAVCYDMAEFIEQCKETQLPERIGKKLLPKDLNEITYGQRIDLSEIDGNNFILHPLKVICEMSERDILRQNIAEVIRFSFMVVQELERLNKRDERFLKYDPEPEEVKAGVNKMDNGLFGIIDTIARRMNITHDEVLALSQQKVFMMLKIDLDNYNYSKRLRKAYQDKQ